MAVVLEALYGGVLSGAVHPLDLALGPGMVRLCEPVLDAIRFIDHVEAHRPGDDRVLVPRLLFKLDAVFGQDRVDLTADGLEHVLQEVRDGAPVSLFDELGHR